MRAQGDVAGHWHRRQGSRGEAVRNRRRRASAGRTSRGCSRASSSAWSGASSVSMRSVSSRRRRTRHLRRSDADLWRRRPRGAADAREADRIERRAGLLAEPGRRGFTWITSYFGPFGLSWRLLVLDDQSRSYEFRHELPIGAGRTRQRSAPAGAAHRGGQDRGDSRLSGERAAEEAGSPRAIDSRSERGSATAIASSASITIRVFSSADPSARPAAARRAAGRARMEPRPRRGWSSNTGSCGPSTSSSSTARRSRRRPRSRRRTMDDRPVRRLSRAGCADDRAGALPGGIPRPSVTATIAADRARRRDADDRRGSWHGATANRRAGSSAVPDAQLVELASAGDPLPPGSIPVRRACAREPLPVRGIPCRRRLDRASRNEGRHVSRSDSGDRRKAVLHRRRRHGRAEAGTAGPRRWLASVPAIGRRTSPRASIGSRRSCGGPHIAPRTPTSRHASMRSRTRRCHRACLAGTPLDPPECRRRRCRRHETIDCKVDRADAGAPLDPAGIRETRQRLPTSTCTKRRHPGAASDGHRYRRPPPSRW